MKTKSLPEIDLLDHCVVVRFDLGKEIEVKLCEVSLGLTEEESWKEGTLLLKTTNISKALRLAQNVKSDFANATLVTKGGDTSFVYNA
jgi:hypothetical protein